MTRCVSFASFCPLGSRPCVRVLQVGEVSTHHRISSHRVSRMTPNGPPVASSSVYMTVTSPKVAVSKSSSTLICISLTGKSADEQLQEMSIGKEAGADIAEIRVDLLSETERPHWMNILSKRVLPVIVTNRAAWEGGMAREREEERLSVLLSAANSGSEYIDVELKAADAFRKLSTGTALKAKLILSHHNFVRAMDQKEVNEVYQNMINQGADVCKIAMAATSARHNGIVFDSLSQLRERPFIMLAMGELGQCSRILAPKFGSFLTFASVATGRESAPGQVDTLSLTKLYRFKNISPATKVFGIIGNPVGHSMSPSIHNAAFSDASIDAVYVPLKVDDDVAEFITAITRHGFRGFSVTIPGKMEALRAMDHIEEVAAKIGAMNTVVVQENGSLWGYNTDWSAAISAIEDGLEQSGKTLRNARVLCLGAGGTARSLSYGALARGAKHVVIANRTLSKAVALASDIGDCASAISLDQDALKSETNIDVVMNTTSIGMHPNVSYSPLPSGWFQASKPLVFDAVYNPLDTRLLKDAVMAGCVRVSGIEMFIRQAIEQFRLWHPDVEPNVSLMRRVVLDRLITP